MARWSANVPSITPVAVADTTNYTDAGYLAIQGGSSTQRGEIVEIFMGGAAAASAPTPMVLARDSTIGATALSGARLAALDPATAALAAPPVAFTTSTTKPQRSATLSLLPLPFNAFGGTVRWIATDKENISYLGNTASLGELSLSAYTGGTPGLMGITIFFEPM